MLQLYLCILRLWNVLLSLLKHLFILERNTFHQFLLAHLSYHHNFHSPITTVRNFTIMNRVLRPEILVYIDLALHANAS